MDVKFLRLAQVEFEEAVTHYESEQEGLGDRFRSEVLRSISRICQFLGRLQAATEANDMNLPGLYLHQLKDKSKGRWAVRVSGNWRVIFGFEPPDAIDIDYEDYH